MPHPHPTITFSSLFHLRSQDEAKTSLFADDFYFESIQVLHKEEIYVIDDLDFVGSVGGSLGLFIGFSFYSYFMDFIQTLIQHFCNLQGNGPAGLKDRRSEKRVTKVEPKTDNRSAF